MHKLCPCLTTSNGFLSIPSESCPEALKCICTLRECLPGQPCFSILNSVMGLPFLLLILEPLSLSSAWKNALTSTPSVSAHLPLCSSFCEHLSPEACKPRGRGGWKYSIQSKYKWEWKEEAGVWASVDPSQTASRVNISPSAHTSAHAPR